MIDKIILGNCLDVMQRIPPGSVDMILCDLPYGTTACKWDTIIPFEPLWAQYRRIIKDRGAIVLFAGQPFTSKLVMSAIDIFRYSWVWDKCLPTGHLDAKRRPLRRHEDVVIFSVKPNTYFPIMRTGKLRNKGSGGQSDCYGTYHKVASRNDRYYPTSILSMSNANQSAKIHPTQKPVALFEYLIKTYTNPGELVLDNCIGSGTTAVAAINTGRHFIGIEQDPNYHATAQARVWEKGVSI